MAMKDTYPFIPDISTFDFFYFCFHCWIPPVFMIVSTTAVSFVALLLEAMSYRRGGGGVWNFLRWRRNYDSATGGALVCILHGVGKKTLHVPVCYANLETVKIRTFDSSKIRRK